MIPNAYQIYGGTRPYSNSEMINKVVKPLLGENFDAYLDIYNQPKEIIEKYREIENSLDPNGGELVYISSSLQGSARFYKNHGIIKASILHDYMIQGAIYVKK